MTIDEAIQVYLEIARRVFSKRKQFPGNGIFSAKELEKVIGEIVGRHCNGANAPMMDTQTETENCKT